MFDSLSMDANLVRCIFKANITHAFFQSVSNPPAATATGFYIPIVDGLTICALGISVVPGALDIIRPVKPVK
jgi:hypothetical protein